MAFRICTNIYNYDEPLEYWFWQYTAPSPYFCGKINLEDDKAAITG